MKPNVNKPDMSWQNKSLTVSIKMLALIIMLTCVSSTLMLSFLPSGVFVSLVVLGLIVWNFHQQILVFFTRVKQKKAEEIYPALKDSIININNIKHFKRTMRKHHRNMSGNISLEHAVNQAEYGHNNVLTFPVSGSTNKKRS
jgi:membrane protein insertase Oxa1/YidC/SpoIIIJ